MRFIRLRTVLPAMLGVLLLVGCGKSHDPIAGGIEGDVAPAAVQQSSDSSSGTGNRVLWGLWKISISADRQTITVVPDRVGALHFNVVRLIEVAPCTDCLRIKNVKGTADGLSADVILIHPFPGLLQYTGFDVRGIFISGADYAFPVSGRKIAWGDDVARMLNSDGYTHLFNPTNFPYTKPPILGYIPGHKAPGGDLSATLNPYVAYEQDKPRCVFMPGTVSTRTVFLYLPPGPLEFGYAVDASWFPAGVEVTDPIKNFPPQANAFEAYRISVEVGDEPCLVWRDEEVRVEVFDHQGLETIRWVRVEVPGLFTGEVELTYSETTAQGGFLFTGTISNEHAVSKGPHPLLVRVKDTETDGNLGIVDAWQVHPVMAEVGWARTWRGPFDDWATGVAVDGSGNVFVTGHFEGTADFDPGGGDPHTSNGNEDVYLSKFDSSGDFQWARTWGGSGFDRGWGVAADSAGNVYVTGEFYGKVDFDPDGGDSHSSNGGHDVFLSKLDSSGNFQWARTWGGGFDDRGQGVATDASGYVYITGWFRDRVVFDPDGGDISRSHGWEDVFLGKFDSSGNFEWVQTWGGPHADFGSGVAADGSGSVWVTGSFQDMVEFNPVGGDESESNGGWDAFVSKFDSSGGYQWARTWGGPESDYGNGVAADGSGSVCVTGHFEETVDFAPPPGGDPHTSNGSYDIYLSRFDPSGDLEWARTWGGPGLDEGRGVAIDGAGNVCMTGQFEDTVDFNPGVGDVRTSNGWADVYLGKLDSSAEFVWARTWGGSDWDAGIAVAVDASDRIYVTGLFGGTVDFAPTGPPCNDGPDEHTATGSSDVFLTKYLPDGCW